MKTRAFALRVLICLLLSLIPLADLENFLYSTRFQLRSQLRGSSSRSSVLIVEVPSAEFQSTPQLRTIQNSLQNAFPEKRGSAKREIWIAPRNDAKALIYDRDGVVRRSPARSGFGRTGEALPFWIDFRGVAGSIPRCTLKQVMNSAPGCKPEGKNLLLADDFEDTSDLRTPVGDMSRAEVLANVWNTQLLSQPIYRVPFVMSLGMIFAMILLVAFYVLYYPVIIHAAAVAATWIAVPFLLFQLVFQWMNIYIPAANLSLSMLITYLVFSGFRLADQENLQWRSHQQAQYLGELDQMKTNFLSLMSHDLKTPIAKIQAVNERLKRELRLPAEKRSDWMELLDSIENSNNELKHYITSILNLSRIESQKIILNRKSNDINVLIRQTIKRLHPLAQHRGIQIEEMLEPLFSVECDEDLIKQVISNLLDNALKYSPPKSLIIVRSQEEGPLIRVHVQDFGPGIPQDQLPQMFRKFNRLLHNPSDPVKGTGLGLYLSKYFIEMHGGTIRVESIVGRGTTFSFTLPIEAG